LDVLEKTFVGFKKFKILLDETGNVFEIIEEVFWRLTILAKISKCGQPKNII
jgi:hypothetical protein